MAYRTIVVVGEGIRKEALAAAAITPGHLVQYDSAGKLKVHATAGGFAARLFAIEDDLQGNEIGDAYSSGNQVIAEALPPGAEVYAIIANGENIAKGDILVSAGDGTLKEADTDSSGTIVEQHPIAVALEAIDLSDSSAADPASSRCLVMIA